MKRIREPKLRKLAKQYCPTIIHGLSKGSHYLIDFPTEIYTTKFDPIKNGLPAIYYNGWEHEGDTYLMYGIFHRRDINHEFDFEGWVVEGSQYRYTNVVSVSHFQFILENNAISGSPMYVEAGGHGISPFCNTGALEYRIKPYRDRSILKYIPMHGKRWNETVKKASPYFKKAGVKFPWQWNSFDGKHLLRQFCIKKVHDKCDGMIWYRPDLVFRFMEGERRSLVPDLKEYVETKSLKSKTIFEDKLLVNKDMPVLINVTRNDENKGENNGFCDVANAKCRRSFKD